VIEREKTIDKIMSGWGAPDEQTFLQEGTSINDRFDPSDWERTHSNLVLEEGAGLLGDPHLTSLRRIAARVRGPPRSDVAARASRVPNRLCSLARSIVRSWETFTTHGRRRFASPLRNRTFPGASASFRLEVIEPRALAFRATSSWRRVPPRRWSGATQT